MVIKPNRCGMCDKRISNKKNYCFSCGENKDEKTHLFGGLTQTGEAVCAPNCWCKVGEE